MGWEYIREDRPKDDRPWKIQRPGGAEKFILEHCQWQPYLIFSTKLNVCVCTACNEEMTMDGMYLTHSVDRRLTTYCPSCGREVVPKDARYGRKKLLDRGRITWMKGYKGVTFIETDEFWIDYATPHPAVLLAPVQQIRLAKDSQVRTDWKEGWWTPGHWEKFKRIGLAVKPHCLGLSEWHDHLWKIDVGTDLRYADMSPERFDDGQWDEHLMISRLITYMSEFLKYPAIELLEKAGFDTIVMNRASGHKSRAMNIRGKNLREILRLNNRDIRKLREIEPTVRFLEDIRNVRTLVPDAAIEDVEELSRIADTLVNENVLEMMKAQVDMRKLMLRILKERRETGCHFTLRDYGDYLGAVNKLGRRLDKKTLYPKSFQQAHDEAVDAVDRTDDAVQIEAFEKSQLRITGMDGPFCLGDYLIRPAVSPAELRKESRALCHCVRTYVDRIVEGRTSILFIREQEKPDIPFYTLELSPAGRMVQCRGDHNKAYPEDVGKFIGAWMDWRKKMIKRRPAI